MDIMIDQVFMQEAIKQAKLAYENDEVPIGAVVVFENKIIARAYNQVELLKDATAHAEMLALTQAMAFIGSKWLHKCSLYVTLEPCSMCAGAMVLARLQRMVFAASDPKAGACGSILNISNHKQLNHRFEVSSGILDKECGYLLSQFFLSKRKKPVISE